MSGHILWSWTTIVWNIIQIKHGSEELWPGHGFSAWLHCDLDLGDMTLGTQGVWHTLGPWKTIVCNIFQIKHGSKELLEIWPWVKVMTHPWVKDNNCVKYYPDPTRQWGVIARTRILGLCSMWPWNWRYDLGHDTPLGHGQQSCKILSRSDKGVRS